MTEKKPILVAVDPRGCASVVVERAAELAADLGTSVVLCTVVDPPEGVTEETLITDGPLKGKTALQALEEDALQSLDFLKLTFDRYDVKVKLEVLHGDAAEAVLEHAPGYRMLVCGTHGRRGIKRFFFGSVAEQIVRRAPIPVMTVRAEGADLHPSPTQQAIAALGDG